MKKVLYTLIAAIFFTGVSFADFEDYTASYGSQGFQDDSAAVITPINKLLKMRDNTTATIKGNIVKRLSDDKYLFHDATGNIIVEIEYKDWAGLTVNAKDTLELSGKLDKEFNEIEFEVFSVKKVK